MFDDQQQDPQASTPEKKVVDMFADTDSSSMPTSSSPTAQSIAGMNFDEHPHAGSKRKLIIGIVVGVLVIGTVIAASVQFVILKPATADKKVLEQQVSQPPQPIEVVSQDTALVAPQEQSPLQQIQNSGTPMPEQPAVDSDGDGLSDDDEKAKGTNPDAVDSDGDNLSDREEVQVYLSDPLKGDTDGDGYLDGQEVANGYDPKGPGKLLELPSNQ